MIDPVDEEFMVEPCIDRAREELRALMLRGHPSFYELITIAEVLYRNRRESLDLSDIGTYEQRSYDWCKAVAAVVYGRRAGPDASCLHQLFNIQRVSPEFFKLLGRENCRQCGIVETYIYGLLYDGVKTFDRMLEDAGTHCPCRFDVIRLLSSIESDHRFRRSVGNAYEIAVYALFDVVRNVITATSPKKMVYEDPSVQGFDEILECMLGVPVVHGRIKDLLPVEVKYISAKCAPECPMGDILSDRFFIVCKSIEATAIEAVMLGLGFRSRLRGVITEVELRRWYAAACGSKCRERMCQNLIKTMVDLMRSEFPVTKVERVKAFVESRGYQLDRLTGVWEVRVDSKPSPKGRRNEKK